MWLVVANSGAEPYTGLTEERGVRDSGLVQREENAADRAVPRE